MRKVELIYLHALFAQLYDHVAMGNDLHSEAFEEYETTAVGPYQIQCRKADHEVAVKLLLEGLGASLPKCEDSVESDEQGDDSLERRREPPQKRA